SSNVSATCHSSSASIAPTSSTASQAAESSFRPIAARLSLVTRFAIIADAHRASLHPPPDANERPSSPDSWKSGRGAPTTRKPAAREQSPRLLLTAVGRRRREPGSAPSGSSEDSRGNMLHAERVDVLEGFLAAGKLPEREGRPF